jgi:DNA-binding transcriptional ArsR family regulator
MADDVVAVTEPQQFKALGHPTRHRLLFALGQGDATISQLAAALDSNKGNVAHHLRVLTDAGLVQPAGTRQVRGGTEQYFRRAARALSYGDAATTEVAFRAIAAEIAAARPDPFLVHRTLRLTAEHAGRLLAVLREVADAADDGAAEDGAAEDGAADAEATARYSVLLGFYQPGYDRAPK